MHWAQEHFPTFIAGIEAVRQIFTITELMKMAIVAVLTIVGTTYVITVRLDERTLALKILQEHLANEHREFSNRLATQESVMSRVDSRQGDVIKRLERLEDAQDRRK